MTEWDTEKLAADDKRYLWHPFTPMGDWCAPDHEPLVLVEGRRAILKDSRGRKYIDGNSSIWTNIHGHNHPHINAAIREQLERVAHTSFLGFTNPAAIELARMIVELFPPNTLSRVFYSDDGSTGMEVALRIVSQYWHLKGATRRKFISFSGGYHGDTAGAAALGATTMFPNGPFGWNFPAQQVGSVAELEALSATDASKMAAVVIEPMVQGAAGMRLWPPDTFGAVRGWCDRFGVVLIADEVLTGFGRTGKMFGCNHDECIPDIMILGKALTGGYLPLSITLINEEIFKPFGGSSGEYSTLFYGHSFTGNPLGCAAARASLEIFSRDRVLDQIQPKIAALADELNTLRGLEMVSAIRQIGMIAAVDLHSEAGRFTPKPMQRTLGAAVCLAARTYGLLIRPIRDTIILMPPLSISADELKRAVAAIRSAILDISKSAEQAKAVA